MKIKTNRSYRTDPKSIIKGIKNGDKIFIVSTTNDGLDDIIVGKNISEIKEEIIEYYGERGRAYTISEADFEIKKNKIIIY